MRSTAITAMVCSWEGHWFSLKSILIELSAQLQTCSSQTRALLIQGGRPLQSHLSNETFCFCRCRCCYHGCTNYRNNCTCRNTRAVPKQRRPLLSRDERQIQLSTWRGAIFRRRLEGCRSMVCKQRWAVHKSRSRLLRLLELRVVGKPDALWL